MLLVSSPGIVHEYEPLVVFSTAPQPPDAESLLTPAEVAAAARP
jgi:hypothetical protein